MKTLKPALLDLLAAAALAAALAYMATAEAASNSEKPYYSVDQHSFDSEHALAQYLLSNPNHGDITMHQCVVLTEELKFKKCTLSSRHL